MGLETFKPPRMKAKLASTCGACEKPVRKDRDEVMKDFETGWWVHVACLADELAGQHGDERLERLQHFRDSVVDAARCSRCGAGIGALCRELGKERKAVHRQRIVAAERVSTVVVASGSITTT